MIPQKVSARSSCSTNSIAYVRTFSDAANCATTRAESLAPCLLFTETTEPTRSSRVSWTAAPCLFNFVALAGVVNEHFCRSSPDIPTEAWSAIRLLRRFAIWLRLTVAFAACDFVRGGAGFRFIVIGTLEGGRGRCNVPFVTFLGYPAELLDSSN
jgi:hypothetical protein